MRSVGKTKTRGSDLSKLKQLLGPPPVLASESLKDYNAILNGLMEAVKPDDFVLEILVAEHADWTWETSAISAIRPWVVERKRLGQLRDQEDLIERIREGVAAKGGESE